jgi:hypothetical protein
VPKVVFFPSHCLPFQTYGTNEDSCRGPTRVKNNQKSLGGSNTLCSSKKDNNFDSLFNHQMIVICNCT